MKLYIVYIERNKCVARILICLAVLMGMQYLFIPAQEQPLTPAQLEIRKRFSALLDTIKDKTPVVQDEAYNTLLEYVSKLSPEEISREVKTDITYRDLLTQPEKFRGQIIRSRGHLVYAGSYHLKANPANVNSYYAGMFTNLAAKETYWFNVINTPTQPLRSFKENGSAPDEVEVEGAFLKIAAYEVDPAFDRTHGQDSIRYAPLIIGRRVIKIVTPPPVALQEFETVIALAVGVFVVGIIIYVMISAGQKRKKLLAKSPPHNYKNTRDQNQSGTPPE